MRTVPGVLLLVGLLPFVLVADTEACTAFLVADGDVVLFGNNEDFWNPLINMWFVPAGEGTYGRVCFGYDDYSPQGGMNEKGLVFDGFATEPRKVTKSADKPKYVGHILDDALAKCATVEEVIAFFDKYNLEFLERAMLMFADRSGDAVIIEGDDLIRKQGKFQIVTNFYQSQYQPDEYPCRRYKTAHRMLSGSDEFTVDLCERVLDAVHADGQAATLYSNVYDLKRGLVHLYHFHDFENAVVIDVAEELKRGERYVTIPSLFSESAGWEKFRKKRLQSLDQRRASRRLIEVEPKFLAAYVGKYQVPDDVMPGACLTISREGDKLYGRYMSMPRFELLPESPTKKYHLLYMRDIDFRFVREGSRPATALEVNTAGQRIVCERVDR